MVVTNLFFVLLFLSHVDFPVQLNQLLESLPALPPCELVDPADDQTLPRLIEVLERRQHIRQMITKQFNQTGTTFFLPNNIVLMNTEIIADNLLFCCTWMHYASLFCSNHIFYKTSSNQTIYINFTVGTLKSKLQQFDSQLCEKETFLHDQRNELSEKEKEILNQKSEIERLEKKSKTLEYKVLFPFFVFFMFSNINSLFSKWFCLFSVPSHFCVSFSD